ncbi:ferredoxin, partial [Psychromonas sp. PRT-SC03]
AYMSHHSISRRGLFRGIFTGVKHSFVAENNISIRTVARPPKAIAEAQFLMLCDGCKLCKQACAQQIIQWQDNKPIIDLDYNFCDQCGECVAACPTGALTDSAEQSIDAVPQFISTCNNKISGYCLVCVQSCPVKALSVISGELPILDTTLCNGCGQCCNACFINAISMKFALK